MSSESFVSKSMMLGFVICCVTLLANACNVSGREGDTCNPLVVQDECNPGLRCTQTTCAHAYCCPMSGASNQPNCNLGGCPDDEPDADVDAGADAGTAGAGEDAGR